jgi:hypothetical protein
MHIEVNGTRLWFDVDGPGLVPDGPAMRARPTIVLVHGGPGGPGTSGSRDDLGCRNGGDADEGVRGSRLEDRLAAIAHRQ